MIRGRHQAVYVISVAAELAGMHPQTLRKYQRRGLVQPARTTGGNRRYSDADIEQLQIENARLRAELDEARRAAEHAAATVREQRRDLVPLRQALAPFGDRAHIFRSK